MRTNLLTTFFLIFLSALLTSCATTSPNQTLIVGKWKPVTVEKILPEQASTDQQASTAGTPSGTSSQAGEKQQAGKSGRGGSTTDNRARAEEQFNRLYRAEQRATLEVFADKNAVKDYNGTYVKATWKMKSNGKKIVAKNIKTKEKFVLEILEVSEKQLIIKENLPGGAFKITYAKE